MAALIDWDFYGKKLKSFKHSGLEPNTCYFYNPVHKNFINCGFCFGPYLLHSSVVFNSADQGYVVFKTTGGDDSDELHLKFADFAINRSFMAPWLHVKDDSAEYFLAHGFACDFSAPLGVVAAASHLARVLKEHGEIVTVWNSLVKMGLPESHAYSLSHLYRYQKALRKDKSGGLDQILGYPSNGITFCGFFSKMKETIKSETIVDKSKYSYFERWPNDTFMRLFYDKLPKKIEHPKEKILNPIQFLDWMAEHTDYNWKEYI